MTLKRLLKKLGDYLHEDKHKAGEKLDGLCRVLKKLKAKEMKLQQDIDAEKDDEERRVLEQELTIVHGQREKGIALLSDLRGRNPDKPAQD